MLHYLTSPYLAISYLWCLTLWTINIRQHILPMSLIANKKENQVLPQLACVCGRKAVAVFTLDLNTSRLSQHRQHEIFLALEFSYPSDFVATKTRFFGTCVARENKSLVFVLKYFFFFSSFYFLVNWKEKKKKRIKKKIIYRVSSEDCWI